MQSLAYVTLDLQDVNAMVTVSAKQNDRLSRTITAQLRDGGVAWVPGAGVAAAIRYRKPDGTAGFYDALEDETPAYSISGSVITFTLAEQMLTMPGGVAVEINFYSGAGQRLTSFSFLLRVQASVLSDAEIVSSDYYNVLTAQVAQAVAAANEAAEIAANLPTPAATVPLADNGSGSVGTSAFYARGDHRHPLNVDNTNPAELGTVAPGSAGTYARRDHVHPMPTADDVGAASIVSAGNFGTGGATFTLPSNGNYLILTIHATTEGNVGLWVYRTSNSKFFNLAGGSNITLSGNGTAVTATSGSGTVALYYMKVS